MFVIKRSVIFNIIISLHILAMIACNPSRLSGDGKGIKLPDYEARLATFAPLMGNAIRKMNDPEYMAQKRAEIQKLYPTPQQKAFFSANGERVPLIIVPSLLGSRIHAKLNKNESAHSFCYKKTHDYYLLWLDVTAFIPFKIECLFENVELHYKRGAFYNYPGVDTRIDDVGGVSSVEYIDNLKKVGLWHEPIKLLTAYGYQINKDLRAFPYDWRTAPMKRSGDKTFSKPKSADSLDIWEQYAALKAMVEETYEMNGQKKVAFTSLSMGGTWLNLFFTEYVDQAWKNKYVHSFTSFCAPWAGSSEALEFNLHPPKYYWIPHVPIPKSFRELSRNMPSITWLWPKKSAYGNEPIVKTPNRGIKANITDITNMWNGMKEYNLAELHNMIEPFGEPKAPGVRHICAYSYNITTLHGLEFSTDNLADDNYNKDHPPMRINGDGDSTVLKESLSLCEKWPGTETHKIPNVTHGMDMSDVRMIKVLFDVLGIPTPKI